MNRMERFSFVLLILLSLELLPFLISPVYSAYGTLKEVTLNAPSYVGIGQEIQVQAIVSTRTSG